MAIWKIIGGCPQPPASYTMTPLNRNLCVNGCNAQYLVHVHAFEFTTYPRSYTGQPLNADIQRISKRLTNFPPSTHCYRRKLWPKYQLREERDPGTFGGNPASKIKEEYRQKKPHYRVICWGNFIMKEFVWQHIGTYITTNYQKTHAVVKSLFLKQNTVKRNVGKN